MVSIVIATLDEERSLGGLLAQLAKADGANEVIVVDGGSRDGTREVAARAGARLLTSTPPCRGRQLDIGARAAKGPVLLFLHADVLPPRQAPRLAERALADPGVAGGGFRLEYGDDHPALRLLERLSAWSWRGAFFGDQGFFCRRDDYLAAGGYPAWPLFEDVGLAHALARRGRLVKLAERTRSSPRRFRAAGPWRQLGRNAALWLAFHAGVSPERLARWYGARAADPAATRRPLPEPSPKS